MAENNDEVLSLQTKILNKKVHHGPMQEIFLRSSLIPYRSKLERWFPSEFPL
jgi:hypothetical protein